MDDDLDELLGDLDILGQAQENDLRMGTFPEEDSLGRFGEISGCQTDAGDPQVLPRHPLEDIMDVEDHQQELFWAVPREKARINGTSTPEFETRKKARGFLKLGAADHRIKCAPDKLQAINRASATQLKPRCAVQDIRRKRKITQSNELVSENQRTREFNQEQGQFIPKSATRRFRVFKKKEDIQGESIPVVSSTGKTVYVPCGRPPSTVLSKDTSKEHSLLPIPIRKLVEECKHEAQKKSERRMDPQLLKPLDVLRPDVRQPWVQEYAPMHFRNLLSDDKLNRGILRWLKSWDPIVFKGNKVAPDPPGSASDPLYPEKKVALLSGPPGMGKTSLSRVIAEHCGYRPVVINASEDRTKHVLKEKINSAVSMKGMFGNMKPNCLILDEVDGMVASESQGAIEAILEALQPGQHTSKKKKKKDIAKQLNRPIICICNDLYVPALRPLREISEIFSFKCSKPERLVARLEAVCEKEKVIVEKPGLQILVQKTEGDIRACLNTLQFLSSKSKRISVESLEQSTFGNKDFKQSVFDIWNEILFSQSIRRPSKRQNVHKSINFHDLYTKLDDFGELELVCRGVLENMARLQFFDPTLHKSSRAVESLSDAGRMLWSLPQYVPSCIISSARQVGSVQRVILKWPSQETNAHRKLQHNRTVLEAWVSKFSPKALGTSQGILSAMYLIPCLKKLLVPCISTPEDRAPCEQVGADVTRLAAIMRLYGLKFDLRPKMTIETQQDTAGNSSLPWHPGVHLIHEYNVGGNVFASEEARHAVNLKIDKFLRHSHNTQSARQDPQADKKDGFGLDMHNLDDDNAVSDASSGVDANTEILAPRVEKKSCSKKRLSTWLDAHRKEKRRRFMIKAQSTRKPPLTFYYDEGKTDAVRRPARLQDFF